MRRLKVKFYIQQYRKYIYIVVSAVLVGLIVFNINKINRSFLIENPTLFGVLGTLVGAVIGGSFSLMGSVWINSRQQKAVQNIKRKNVIYSPLYDELVDIQDRILVKNSYPNYIAFQKDMQTLMPHPQFTAWGRIKLDTRYLEVPSILVKQMEKLENSIHEYQMIRDNVNKEIEDILNTVLAENKLKKRSIAGIGYEISRSVLENKQVDLYHQAMEFGNDKQLDSSTRELVNKQIYEKCNSNLEVIKTRECYKKWQDIQKETIEMLGILIRQVLLLYEG